MFAYFWGKSLIASVYRKRISLIVRAVFASGLHYIKKRDSQFGSFSSCKTHHHVIYIYSIALVHAKICVFWFAHTIAKCGEWLDARKSRANGWSYYFGWFAANWFNLCAGGWWDVVCVVACLCFIVALVRVFVWGSSRPTEVCWAMGYLGKYMLQFGKVV